jgi:phosphohistidine swiveling domain-containing protein
MHRLNSVRPLLETHLPANHPGAKLLHGVGISGAEYVGRAHVGIIGVDVDVAALSPGAVFVTQATSSSFNLVIPSLGALVCDGGSLLSHPAITAREHGTSCVLAVGGVCSCVRTGDLLRVSPEDGVVEVLEAAAVHASL